MTIGCTAIFLRDWFEEIGSNRVGGERMDLSPSHFAALARRTPAEGCCSVEPVGVLALTCSFGVSDRLHIFTEHCGVGSGHCATASKYLRERLSVNYLCNAKSGYVAANTYSRPNVEPCKCDPSRVPKHDSLASVWLIYSAPLDVQSGK